MGNFGTVKQSVIIKFLEAEGYRKTRQCGSHATYSKQDKTHSFVIAVGKKDAQDYIIRQIMRAFKLTKDELKNKLKDF